MHAYSLSDRIVLTGMMLIPVIILLIVVHFQIKDVMITLGYSGKIKQKKLERHIKTFSIGDKITLSRLYAESRQKKDTVYLFFILNMIGLFLIPAAIVVGALGVFLIVGDEFLQVSAYVLAGYMILVNAAIVFFDKSARKRFK